MFRYTLQQRAKIATIYIKNKSVVLTQREFRKLYGIRTAPTSQTIRRLATHFLQSGSPSSDVKPLGRPRTISSGSNLKRVSESLKDNPETSVRKRSVQLGIARSTLRRMLARELHLLPMVTAAESSETKKATKRVRKPKDVETSSESEEEVPPTKLQKKGKNNTKQAKEKPAAQSKASKPLQNKSSTDFAKIDWDCDKTNASGKPWNFKISSWNVDGIRAWLNKGGMEFLNHEKPDILCLQETKCSEKKLPENIINVPEYSQYWASGEKEGYAGVGIFSKKEPLNIEYGLSEDFDEEGRMITVEYKNFYVVCTYVPNSGRGLVTLPKRLEWNKAFRDHVKELDAKKPVIICGDMNVSHLEIDLANPKTNKKNAGFTQEERDGMTELLGDGFVDTFRKFYPEETGRYTFWTYMSNCRAKNVGWRLDYCIVSERLMSSVCDNIIRSEVYGSDHCPITLFMNVDDK